MDLWDIAAWWLVPLLIFIGETCVVTLGTVRIIFVSRGLKLLAAVLGFCEITIWLLAISQIMQNLTSIVYYVAFGAGFSLGNYLGICIEQRLAIGTQVVRIITPKDAVDLVAALKAANYGVTTVQGQGATTEVQIIFTIIRRRDLDQVVSLIKQFHPKAFYSVEDIRAAREGVFPLPANGEGMLRKSLQVLMPGKRAG
jgi:uncharacterized protein YebE (UPF0316 family)